MKRQTIKQNIEAKKKRHTNRIGNQQASSMSSLKATRFNFNSNYYRSSYSLSLATMFYMFSTRTYIHKNDKVDNVSLCCFLYSAGLLEICTNIFYRVNHTICFRFETQTQITHSLVSINLVSLMN